MTTRQQKLIENYIRLKVKKIISEKKILKEEFTPQPGTYSLQMTVEQDGSVVIKGGVSHRLLANIIGIGNSSIKKYGEYFGQNQLDFLFFTKDKKELFK